MLDTNICIYVLKRTPGNLLLKFTQFVGDLCISSVTLGELYVGVKKSTQRSKNLVGLTEFVARIEVMPFGSSAAQNYGALRAELEKSGRPCGPLDTLIGGHARSENLIVVTNNMREFGRMPGVRAENWV